MDTSPRARIFLVDDHVIVLESLKKLLEPHHDIVGEATGSIDLHRHIRQINPDIVLMDVSMPDQNGYEVSRHLQFSFPTVKIIFVSMHLEPTFIMEAFRSGAKGYIPKQSAGRELLSAIHQVSANQAYLSPLIPEEVRETVLNQMMGMPGREFSGKLTPRQIEILKLLTQGFSAKDMADVLHISQSTVAFHKTQIMQALGLKSKAELTKYAVMKGLSFLD
jgi:DNA-binding NarL/FixJ family response regulator